MRRKTLSVAALLGLGLFMSCEKQEVIREINENNFVEFIEDVEESFDENEDFVNSFIEKINDNKIDEESMLKMLDLLNTENVNFDRLDELNLLDGVYTEIDYIKSNPDAFRPAARCDKLIDIRDAMLDECNRYPFGISDYCGGAVMLAYWWKSRDC